MELLDLHRQFRRYLSIEEGLGIRTVKGMGSAFGTFLKRAKITELNQIDEGLLREFFYDGKEKHNWSQNHYANNHKYLKRFLGWCLKTELVKTNAILEIKIPKAPKTLPRPLSEEAAKKVLFASFDFPWRYAFEQTRNYTIISMLFFTGLRMGELLNLQVTDINIREQSLLVRHGKGDKDRMVPLHYKLIRVLERYFRERKNTQKRSEWLFTGIGSDKQLLAKDLYRMCKKIAKHSGVIFTPHQLRHTFGTTCIEQGMGVVQLKEIMGHSNIASTMIYLKVSTKNLRESLNKLELF